MAWADPASWSKSDSELASLLPVFYSKRLRELGKGYQGLWQTVEDDPLATRSGSVATFMQYAKMSPQAASTVLTEGVNPDPTDMVTGKISVTVVEKGGVVAIPSLARQTIVDGAEKVAQVVSAWGNETMERHVAETLAAKLSMVRVDGDGTYEDDSVTTSLGGTTILVNDTGRTEATNSWAGGLVTITDPYVGTFGESQYVASNIQNTSVTLSVALSAVLPSGTRYHISIPTAITTGDSLTVTGIRLAQKFLRKNGCMGPNFELDGGGYNIVLDPVTEADVQASLISAFTYKPNEAVERKYPDRGMIAMCRPTITTIPFRSAVGGAGTYAAEGAVHYTPVFGKNCVAKLPLEHMGIQVLYKGEDSGGTSNPGNRFSTHFWGYTGAFLMRNAAAGCSILTVES